MRMTQGAPDRPERESRPPEIRLDQLTGLRTILAPARADRPFDFGGIATEPDADAAENCPFYEGREDRTPPETWADRPGGGEPDSPGWRVRAVPNLYPALAQAWDGDTGASEPDPSRAWTKASPRPPTRCAPHRGAASPTSSGRRRRPASTR